MKGLLWSVLRSGGSSLCVPHTVTQGDQSWTPKNCHSTGLQTCVYLQAMKSCDTAVVFLSQPPAHKSFDNYICIYTQLTEFGQTFLCKCSKSCLNQFDVLFFNLFRSMTRADLPLQLLHGKGEEVVAPLWCQSAGCQVCMQCPAARLWGIAYSITFCMRFCVTK